MARGRALKYRIRARAGHGPRYFVARPASFLRPASFSKPTHHYSRRVSINILEFLATLLFKPHLYFRIYSISKITWPIFFRILTDYTALMPKFSVLTNWGENVIFSYMVRESYILGISKICPYKLIIQYNILYILKAFRIYTGCLSTDPEKV